MVKLNNFYSCHVYLEPFIQAFIITHILHPFCVFVSSHVAVNACLYPLCSVHGKAVTTVEGIGSTRTKLHAVQVYEMIDYMS